jgi:hypothetical protein
MKKNLIYFICPLRPVWRWNVSRLKDYWGMFNGRKIISIVTGAGFETPDAVQREFEGCDAEFIIKENNWYLGETVSFLDALEKLKGSDSVTFYAHAKGVSHEGSIVETIRQWADAMYVLNLSSSDLIEKLMGKYSSVGCFRNRGRHGGADWHYSGTFFWLDNQKLFCKDWKRIEQSRFGVEGYPGIHFSEAESFDLAPADPSRNLYVNPPPQKDCLRWLGELGRKLA